MPSQEHKLPSIPSYQQKLYHHGRLIYGWIQGCFTLLLDRWISLFMDGHPQATVVLFPCSLSQGFKKATMGITLFYLFHLFLALRWVARGWVLHIQVSAGDESRRAGDRGVVYGRRRRCLVWLETEMSCMTGDGDVSYHRRWLLTLTQADGIQPYLHFHIYRPCGPLR